MAASLMTPVSMVAAEEQAVEEIVVTGSRIRRDEFTSASPIQVIDAEDLAASSVGSLDEYLQDIPAFTGFQLGASTNNGNNGVKMVDMRGLGHKRTLILINGRRSVGSFIGGTSDVGAVDLNAIPMSMIERVEVLKDGASTVYGSDALGGVVNIILRDEVEGVEFAVETGTALENSDGDTRGLSILAGASNDRGSFALNMQYFEQEEVKQAARGFSHDALYPLLTNGSFVATASGSSNSRRIRGLSTAALDMIAANGGSGSNFITDASGAAREFAPTDVYNYAPVNALITPHERWQLSGNGRYEIADEIAFFGEASYTKRTSHQRLAPDASFGVTPDFNGQWNDLVPASNPFNPFGDTPNNPWGVAGEDVRVNRRFEESGGRLFSQEADTFRMVFGFEGVIADGINWDVAYIFADNRDANETNFYHRFDRWATIVDPALCGADAACVAATGPENALNPFAELGTISGAEIAYLMTNSLKDVSKNRLNSFAFNFSGSLGELAGGDIGWAAGYERRREEAEFVPDEFSAEGLTTGGASDPLKGSYTVKEVYAEVLLPIIADAPLAQSVDIEASIRSSDYDSVSDRSTNYRLGANWVVNDQVKFRAAYSTGFRAPNIVELFSGSATEFPVVDVPCEMYGFHNTLTPTEVANCMAAGYDGTEADEYGFAWQSAYTQNPPPPGTLDPEESTHLNLGIVVTPEAIEGLSLSLDYFQIEIDDYIALPSYNVIFRGCLATATASQATAPACQFFDTGTTGFDGFFPDNATATLGNLGKVEEDGFDFAAEYIRLVDWGPVEQLEVSLTGAVLNERVESFPGLATLDRAGTAFQTEVYPELRWNTYVGLTGENWSAGWTMRFFDEADDLWRNPAVTDDAVAEDIFYHDLSGYYVYRGFTIRVGLDNVLDEDPPRFHNAFNANSSPGTYDTLGRKIWTRISYSL